MINATTNVQHWTALLDTQYICNLVWLTLITKVVHLALKQQSALTEPSLADLKHIELRVNSHLQCTGKSMQVDW